MQTRRSNRSPLALVQAAAVVADHLMEPEQEAASGDRAGPKTGASAQESLVTASLDLDLNGIIGTSHLDSRDTQSTYPRFSLNGSDGGSRLKVPTGSQHGASLARTPSWAELLAAHAAAKGTPIGPLTASTRPSVLTEVQLPEMGETLYTERALQAAHAQLLEVDQARPTSKTSLEAGRDLPQTVAKFPLQSSMIHLPNQAEHVCELAANESTYHSREIASFGLDYVVELSDLSNVPHSTAADGRDPPLIKRRSMPRTAPVSAAGIPSIGVPAAPASPAALTKGVPNPPVPGRSRYTSFLGLEREKDTALVKSKQTRKKKRKRNQITWSDSDPGEKDSADEEGSALDGTEDRGNADDATDYACSDGDISIPAIVPPPPTGTIDMDLVRSTNTTSMVSDPDIDELADTSEASMGLGGATQVVEEDILPPLETEETEESREMKDKFGKYRYNTVPPNHPTSVKLPPEPLARDASTNFSFLQDTQEVLDIVSHATDHIASSKDSFPSQISDTQPSSPETFLQRYHAKVSDNHTTKIPDSEGNPAEADITYKLDSPDASTETNHIDQPSEYTCDENGSPHTLVPFRGADNTSATIQPNSDEVGVGVVIADKKNSMAGCDNQPKSAAVSKAKSRRTTRQRPAPRPGRKPKKTAKNNVSNDLPPDGLQPQVAVNSRKRRQPLPRKTVQLDVPASEEDVPLAKKSRPEILPTGSSQVQQKNSNDEMAGNDSAASESDLPTQIQSMDDKYASGVLVHPVVQDLPINRVFVYWKEDRAFWPAEIIGIKADGVQVRFDDTTKQIASFKDLRRCELFPGDPLYYVGSESSQGSSSSVYALHKIYRLEWADESGRVVSDGVSLGPRMILASHEDGNPAIKRRFLVESIKVPGSYKGVKSLEDRKLSSAVLDQLRAYFAKTQIQATEGLTIRSRSNTRKQSHENEDRRSVQPIDHEVARSPSVELNKLAAVPKQEQSDIFKDVGFLLAGYTKEEANDALPDDPPKEGFFRSTNESIVSQRILSTGGTIIHETSELFGFELDPDGRVERQPVNKHSGLKFIILCADRPTQKSLKFLVAVALGIVCISTRWIDASFQARTLQPFWPYMIGTGYSLELGCHAFGSQSLLSIEEDFRLESVERRRGQFQILPGYNVICVHPAGTATRQLKHQQALLIAMGAAQIVDCTEKDSQLMAKCSVADRIILEDERPVPPNLPRSRLNIVVNVRYLKECLAVGRVLAPCIY